MSAEQKTTNPGGEIVELEVSGAIATLRLNDPATRNALSSEMMDRLLVMLDNLGTTPEVHVIILEATGSVFSSGHNLKELVQKKRDNELPALFEHCSALMQSVVNLPKPVIAKIDGNVTAAGTQLIASCDLAYASAGSQFATSGINYGLFCSTPMVALSRNVASKHAMEMLLTGDFIDATRAAEIGLINAVFKAEELAAGVRAIAENIASKSSVVVSMGKTAFYRQRSLPLADAYDLTSRVMCENMQTRDAEEGLTAFIEKRTPEWQGK